MANRLFELQETKGAFQVKGKISGVESNRFYTEKKTKNNINKLDNMFLS